jgi:hypothetical protein
MTRKRPTLFWVLRIVLMATCGFFGLAALQVSQVLQEKNLLATSASWNVFIILLSVISAAFLVFWLASFREKWLISFVKKSESLISSINRTISITAAICISFAYAAFFFLIRSYYVFFRGFIVHALLLWLSALLVFIFLNHYFSGIKKPQKALFLFLLILLCLVFLEELAVGLTEINNYPFSLNWSETSHLYFSSTIFGERIYGTAVPMSPYDQTRYLLQGLPFLFSSLPIWVHRLWQLSLSIGFPLLFLVFLSRRVCSGNGMVRLFFVIWGYVWLSQVYIYYHLVACAMLLILCLSENHWKRNLLLIGIASVWAGFSRVNWIPVPGSLAAFLYFLETRHAPSQNLAKYLSRPALYFLTGISLGLLAQFGYVLISGYQDSSTLTTVFRSYMVWDRLLPNATYPPGILPGMLILTGFMIVFSFRKFFFNAAFQPVRRLCTLLFIAVFFIGGLVVSIKIGGGNNLHNMDAFAIFLLILVSYAYFGKIKPDRNTQLKKNAGMQCLLAGMLVLPVIWSIYFPALPTIYEKGPAEADAAIRTINQTIDQYAVNHKVLFISQRQLLTFGLIKHVPLIPDYEQEVLIDMVMAGDRSRLEDFYKSLREHEFDVIMVNPLNTAIVGDDLSFALENNLWVQGVSRFILKHYQAAVSLPDFGVEMLIPKAAK